MNIYIDDLMKRCFLDCIVNLAVNVYSHRVHWSKDNYHCAISIRSVLKSRIFGLGTPSE